MTTHAESGRTYISTEPCHWGMILIPPAAVSVLNWLDGMRAYRERQFQPYPWANPPTKVDQEA